MKKLEMKVSGLNSAFEHQQQRLKELGSEVTRFSSLLHSIYLVPLHLGAFGDTPKFEIGLDIWVGCIVIYSVFGMSC